VDCRAMLVAAAFAGWARVSATVRTLPAAAVDSGCAECDGPSAPPRRL
jgi:hypothetical protein